jgi:hypothetical protein
MSDHALATTLRRSPFTLPFNVSIALEWARGLLYRAEGAHVQASALYPAAAGATDQGVGRLSQRGDLSEVFRQERAELWKRGGVSLNHI